MRLLLKTIVPPFADALRVYAMQTPDLGIKFNRDAAMSASPSGPMAKGADPAVKWFRTVIELDAEASKPWPDAPRPSYSMDFYACGVL